MSLELILECDPAFETREHSLELVFFIGADLLAFIENHSEDLVPPP
jgi:hypothetical protein